MKKILITINMKEEDKKYFIKNFTNAQLTFMAKKSVTSENILNFDAVIGNIKPELLKTDSVKWLHLESAGTEIYSNINENIILTNSTGAYGECIAEYLIAAVFMLYKSFDQYVKLQINHTWKKTAMLKQVKGSVVTVVGLGDIGKTFSKKMHALGAKIYGVKRIINTNYPYIEKLYTLDNMEEALRISDIVVLALPSTDKTRYIFNYEMLKKIKKDALLINVGRGNLIKTEDLIKVIEENHFYKVFLDVCDPEPLPINSKLWQFDNVIITPHISGSYNNEDLYTQIMEIAKNNLKRFINDEPLINIVDKKEGYKKSE